MDDSPSTLGNKDAQDRDEKKVDYSAHVALSYKYVSLGANLTFTAFLLAMYHDAARLSEIKTLKTREEICEFTEMADFPEFTFDGRSDDSWNIRTTSYFSFTDTLTEAQLNRFSAKCKELDNPRWQQTDSATWTCMSSGVGNDNPQRQIHD